MLDELELRPGHPVLDLGCGPGTDPGALAEAVTAAGEGIGVDHDRAAVDTAEQRTLGQHAVWPPWATSGGSLPTASRPRPEGY
ncbi:methyltransferase domain-containing protein [Streptomyces sp. Ncost-T10-10d]|uniref:methyltransferase domain-containing protein n=1 Tax=Streptomyces sp. Ncost-T10-10d TaxID=1839774 RepID=UPI00081D54F8|nr:methyltransferase domain-containing protein [Streptomyces sp. Ncost-T10-10d]SCF71645.1 Methyltransferase domain-containing protein [Streptomyces sp. Ncost-T10-10d]